MKRRRGREYVLQFLFQFDFTGKRPNEEDFNAFWTDKDEDDEVKGFVRDIFYGTVDNLGQIDEVIKAAAEHWAIDRMAAVDRNILRAATYELLFRKDIPSAVTINEAIEIAKKYSTSESAPFINGILDRIAKGLKDKRVR